MTFRFKNILWNSVLLLNYLQEIESSSEMQSGDLVHCNSRGSRADCDERKRVCAWRWPRPLHIEKFPKFRTQSLIELKRKSRFETITPGPKGANISILHPFTLCEDCIWDWIGGCPCSLRSRALAKLEIFSYLRTVTIPLRAYHIVPFLLKAAGSVI